jgi:hypothetical protein
VRLAFVLALVAVPETGLASPPDPVPDGQVPDIDGLGVLAIARASELAFDATFAYADASEAGALAAGARLGVGQHAFVEGTLPVGWARQPHAFALGNVMIGAGLLPPDGRLAGLAVRIAAPTSPRLGGGMATAAALAAPRNADPELWLPHTTSAELVADWRWRGDATWVQLEAGVAGWWAPAGYQTVLRTSVAGAVRVERRLDLEASFVTRSFLLASDAAENFVHSLALGIVAHHRRGQLAVRLEVPIDDVARNADRFLVGLELRGR